MQKKLTLYVDTSVIGGYFDVEFSEVTQSLFEHIENGKYDIMYSTVTEYELLNAPIQVRELLQNIPTEIKKRVELTKEVVSLADTYIIENVVGKTSRDDCLHIALATINKADILVSWNFKHIVNIFRMRGYNLVNSKLGYSNIDIRSPKELLFYEK